ncbi:ABC transporter substrate-binding protein [Rhodococcus opacus]|uniref:ABC transporter substrate-binding protein n=1 Tax=Rhodococcus opacus TaxID=37919 RepID=UPI000A73E729|nr:ABC transporter substrate-binding protein [Rhodococcus opacus]
MRSKHLRLGAALATLICLLATACATNTPGGDTPDPDNGDFTTVTVGLAAQLPPYAPLLVGDAFGEFQREGIKVDYQLAPSSDNLVLLATGGIDVLLGGISAAVFNASANTDVRVVAPFSPGPGTSVPYKGGLWVSNKLTGGASFNPGMLNGVTIGTQIGDGAVVSAVINQQLQNAGLDITDVKFQQMAAADVFVALESGAIDAGWLSDPVWIDAEADPDFPATFAFGFPPDAVQGAVMYGPNLRNTDPASGEAFLRAYYATIKKYLQGNYHENTSVVSVLAAFAGVSDDEIKRLPPLQFSALLGGKFTESLSIHELQKVYALKKGILQYDTPLSDDEVLDMQFSDRALDALG